jgi:hypothetical protein
VINLNIDLSIRVKRYLFEISFFLLDWDLQYRKVDPGSTRILQIGPIICSITDRLLLQRWIDENWQYSKQQAEE